MIETTWDIIVNEIMAEYLYAPYIIVFPGIPVIVNTVHDPVDPYTPRSIEEMVDEAAGSAERNGYTTCEDEYVDMLF